MENGKGRARTNISLGYPFKEKAQIMSNCTEEKKYICVCI